MYVREREREKGERKLRWLLLINSATLSESFASLSAIQIEEGVVRIFGSLLSLSLSLNLSQFLSISLNLSPSSFSSAVKSPLSISLSAATLSSLSRSPYKRVSRHPHLLSKRC